MLVVPLFGFTYSKVLVFLCFFSAVLSCSSSPFCVFAGYDGWVVGGQLGCLVRCRHLLGPHCVLRPGDLFPILFFWMNGLVKSICLCFECGWHL